MTLLRSLLFGFFLVFFAHTQVFSNSGGIIGAVTFGCTCHGESNTATSLSIPGRTNAISVKPGETLSLSLMVAHASQQRAGMNLAVVNASGTNIGTLISGAGSQLINGQLTHTAPQTISGGSASFPFQWTAPSTPGTYTLRAAGNAVNGDGSSGGDAFNFLSPITITVENPAPAAFSISGRILNSSGVAVPGVLVSISNGTRSATTDAAGNYTIADVPNGTYTLTPSLVNWIFEPTSLSVTVNGANLTGQNIVGKRLWAITGTIVNPSGVAVPNVIVTAASGTTIASTATTDAQGNYTLWVLNGTYTIRPGLTNWVFEPTTLTVAVNGANLSGQNIVGKRLWAVTGTILNSSGVAVPNVIVTAGLGTTIASTATTDASGNYTLWLVNGAYTVRPSLTNWIFEPTTLSVSVAGANIAGQNIVGKRLWAVTGTIVNANGEPLPNVSISAGSGTIIASTATTDAQGNYTVWLVNGAYTLTPSRTNWSFAPTPLAITVVGANLTADRITGRLLMSVKNLSSVSLSLAPNPATEQVTLSYTISSPKRIRYEVFNLLGERVRIFNEQHLSGTHNYVIPTEGLATGMYIVRIFSEGEGTLGSASMMVRGK